MVCAIISPTDYKQAFCINQSARPMATMKFDVFGRSVIVSRVGEVWKTYYGGSEGKRRPATDIVIPASVDAAGLCQYLSDLCHEWATSSHPDVKQL